MTQTLKTNQAFTMLELMIVIAVIALLASIAIPNYISYRNKVYCSQAETDADHTAGAIADYFGTPSRTHLPDFKDLKIITLNHVELFGTDPNDHITIQVTDRTGRCPLYYQDRHPDWDSKYVFTKVVK